jgi:hypothetical protein
MSYGCRYPLGGVVVGIRPMVGLRVKTLDLTVSTAAARCIVTLLGTSLWSPDSTWFRASVSGSKFRLSVFFYLIFDLLCKIVLLSTMYRFDRFGFIYKTGRKPISRRLWLGLVGDSGTNRTGDGV